MRKGAHREIDASTNADIEFACKHILFHAILKKLLDQELYWENYILQDKNREKIYKKPKKILEEIK